MKKSPEQFEPSQEKIEKFESAEKQGNNFEKAVGKFKKLDRLGMEIENFLPKFTRLKETSTERVVKRTVLYKGPHRDHYEKGYGDISHRRPDRTCEYRYNDKGNVIEEIKLNNKTGKIDEKEKYEYDDKGNLIQEYYWIRGSASENEKKAVLEKGSSYKYDDEGNLIEGRHEYIYDEEGSLIKMVGSDGFTFEEFEHDERGNPIRRNSHIRDMFARFEPKYEYEYDKKSNLVRLKGSELQPGSIHEPSWRNEWTNEFEYDEKGNQAKVTRKNINGVVMGTIEYEYDDKGNLKEETHRGLGGESSESFKYDLEYEKKV